MTNRKINKKLELLNLEMNIIKYSFLGRMGGEDVKEYKKKVHQLEFAKRFRNHKIKFNL